MPVKIIYPENFDVLFDIKEIKQAASTAAMDVGKLVQQVMEVYPPETDANRPGRFGANGRPMGYYERGVGEWSPRVNTYSLRSFGNFGKSRGVIKASKIQRATGTVAGYVLVSLSQKLGKHWMTRKYGETGAVVSNQVTYEPYVQAAQFQSSVMKRIGWGTDQNAIGLMLKNNIASIAFFRALRAIYAAKGIKI